MSKADAVIENPPDPKACPVSTQHTWIGRRFEKFRVALARGSEGASGLRQHNPITRVRTSAMIPIIRTAHSACSILRCGFLIWSNSMFECGPSTRSCVASNCLSGMSKTAGSDSLLLHLAKVCFYRLVVKQR